MDSLPYVVNRLVGEVQRLELFHIQNLLRDLACQNEAFLDADLHREVELGVDPGHGDLRVVRIHNRDLSCAFDEEAFTSDGDLRSRVNGLRNHRDAIEVIAVDVGESGEQVLCK